jgi:hypothetical protein
VLIGLDAGEDESHDAWADVRTTLGERGLACPLLVISDGVAGLIGSVERTMSSALRQRCLIHRARNVLAKVPQERPWAGQGHSRWPVVGKTFNPTPIPAMSFSTDLRATPENLVRPGSWIGVRDSEFGDLDVEGISWSTSSQVDPLTLRGSWAPTGRAGIPPALQTLARVSFNLEGH